MAIEETLDQILETLLIIADNTKPKADIPPVVTWNTVYKPDLANLPKNVEMPNAGDINWTELWNPWAAGTGSSDGNRNNASVQIVPIADKSVLQCHIWNTAGRDVGARAFITDHQRWTWWGTQFEGKTVRIKAQALYQKPFTLPNGEGTYFQTFWEFKTLDTPMTAIGVFVRQADDGKLYHYLSLAEQTFGLDKTTDPLVFGQPIDYELEVEFKRTGDAKVIFRYKNTVIEGVGRTLNASNGQGGGAFLVYSNELKNQDVVVQYSGITIETK